MQLIILGAVSVYTALGVFMGHNPWFLILTIIIAATNLVYLKRGGSLNFASNVVVATLCAPFSYLLYKFGGFNSVSFISFPLICYLASFLVTRKQSYFWAIFQGILCVTISTLMHVFDVEYIVYSPLQKGVMLSLAIFVIGLIVNAVGSSYEHSFRLKEEELEKTNQSLQEVAHEREQLLNVLSHDMRNPLSVIMGTTHLAFRKGGLEDSVMRSMERIHHAASMMNSISNSVSELQGLKQGKISVTVRSVDLLKQLDRTIDLLSLKLEEKQLTLETMATSPPYWVMADANSLCTAVLTNIISNAIKFSPRQGKIVCKIEHGVDFIVLRIIDQGIGIPEDLTKRIFHSSEKTTRRGTEGESGTGFGMPIAKAHMDQFGGRISIKSLTEKEAPVNHGTTFSLEFRPAEPLNKSA